jgi:hypothetical protein
MAQVPRRDTVDADTLTHGQVAGLFNAYVACSALTAACDLGVLDQLERDGKIPLPGSGGHDDGLDEPVMLTLLGALQWAGVVEIDGHAVTPGPTFREAYAARGYFLWLVRGCGEVFSAAARLAVTANRTGSFYRRDMGAVATGSHLIGEPQVEPLFDQILSRMQVRKIADLGCGSAARLIRIASRDRHVTGIGLDISPAAVQLATQAVAARGLAGRIRIGRADVRELRRTASGRCASCAQRSRPPAACSYAMWSGPPTRPGPQPRFSPWGSRPSTR